MSGVISDQQKEDLHKSMLDYLLSAGFTRTYEEMKQEVSNMAEYQPEDSGPSDQEVDQRNSIAEEAAEARLQEVLDEQARVSHLPTKPGNVDWLPRNPARHTFSVHRKQITALAFHLVFTSLATASEDLTIKIWDWETGDLERTLKGHSRLITDCQYNGRGKYLVTSSYDLLIKLWDVDDEYKNSITLVGHEHSVSSAKFLPGDDRVISSSRDMTVKIWDIATKHCIKTLRPHTEWIRSALPSLDGSLVLTCSVDHTARLHEISTGAMKVEMRGHDNVVEVAVLCPVYASVLLGNSLRSTSTGADEALGSGFVATASRDKTIKLWSASSGQCVWTFVGHDDWVRALVFHPSGKHLLSAGDDKTIKVWDLKTGRCMRTVAAHDQFVNCMVWGRMAPAITDRPDGASVNKTVNVLATGGADKLVKIWLP